MIFDQIVLGWLKNGVSIFLKRICKK